MKKRWNILLNTKRIIVYPKVYPKLYKKVEMENKKLLLKKLKMKIVNK